MLNAKISNYLDEICSFVKFRRAHEEIKAELNNHLEEKIEDLVNNGINEEAALEKAIGEMGHAEVIGKELNKTHKAGPEWSILILTILLSAIGLTTAFVMSFNYVTRDSHIFIKSTVFTFVGLAFIFALYYFDYKKLEKHSVKIFLLLTIFMIALLNSRPINGITRWLVVGNFTINTSYTSLFLYVISANGIIGKLDYKKIKSYEYSLLVLLIPMIIYVLQFSFMEMVTYFIVVIYFMVKAKIKYSIIIEITMALTVIAGVWIVAEPYRVERILMFMHPQLDPQGGGWLNLQIQNLLNGSGFTGNGFTTVNVKVPDMESHLVMTYLVHTFGWFSAFAVITLFIAFIYRIFKSSLIIKDSFGKNIIQAFMLIYAIGAFINIMMILGLAPIISVNLPFISYGGSALVTNMAAIGLMMSIYKNKSLSYTTI